MYIFAWILGTISLGSFFGMIFTAPMRGAKRILIGITIAILVGSLLTGIFWFEEQADLKQWNNGVCTCGTEWTFANAEHLRNSGTQYYWYCENCQRIIQLHRQFN